MSEGLDRGMKLMEELDSLYNDNKDNGFGYSTYENNLRKKEIEKELDEISQELLQSDIRLYPWQIDTALDVPFCVVLNNIFKRIDERLKKLEEAK